MTWHKTHAGIWELELSLRTGSLVFHGSGYLQVSTKHCIICQMWLVGPGSASTTMPIEGCLTAFYAVTESRRLRKLEMLWRRSLTGAACRICLTSLGSTTASVQGQRAFEMSRLGLQADESASRSTLQALQTSSLQHSAVQTLQGRGICSHYKSPAVFEGQILLVNTCTCLSADHRVLVCQIGHLGHNKPPFNAPALVRVYRCAS